MRRGTKKKEKKKGGFAEVVLDEPRIFPLVVFNPVRYILVTELFATCSITFKDAIYFSLFLSR